VTTVIVTTCMHYKNEVAVFTIWLLLQLHYVERVGETTIIYPVVEIAYTSHQEFIIIKSVQLL